LKGKENRKVKLSHTDNFVQSTSFLRKGACIPFTCHFEDTATGCGIHQYILDFSVMLKPAAKKFSEIEALYYSIPEELLSREVRSDFQVDKLIQLRP